MEGIDVSQWQGYIDFEAVERAGVRLVYIKASEGGSLVDPFFYRNYANAKNAGLSVGFYHYLKARGVGSARQEACHFVSVTEGLVPDGRLVLDLEDVAGLTAGEVNEIALAFLLGVEEYSNQSPAIYADARTAAVLDDTFTAWPLWIAQYGVDAPDTDHPWHDWAGWQYTDRGRVAGIQGNVDRDVFRPEIRNPGAVAVEFRGTKTLCGESGVEYRVYRAKPGDTLHSIAQHNGVTQEMLVESNRGVIPGMIYAGQLFQIPFVPKL